MIIRAEEKDADFLTSEMWPDMGAEDIEIMSLDEINNIEKITGFAGARFSDCINKDDRKPVDDPLHKLFTSGNGEMFEGSESFTWISEE